MIDDILQNRRYVREYDNTVSIPRSLINSVLQRTWKVTPSKNNFMPYNCHVIGPDNQDIKNKVYLNCARNEGITDGVEDPLNERYNEDLPNYANILSCSYLFIFTMRLEDKPNPFQQMLINKGHKYEAVDEDKLHDLYAIASLEVGLFTDCLSALLLENGIDVSFTGCFSRNINDWSDVPFVKRQPIILMTAGKGKVYRDQFVKKTDLEKYDLRPDYYRIVNFVDE